MNVKYCKTYTVSKVFQMKNDCRATKHESHAISSFHSTTSLGIFGCENRLILIKTADWSLTQILIFDQKNLVHCTPLFVKQHVINLLEWNFGSARGTELLPSLVKTNCQSELIDLQLMSVLSATKSQIHYQIKLPISLIPF